MYGICGVVGFCLGFVLVCVVKGIGCIWDCDVVWINLLKMRK